MTRLHNPTTLLTIALIAALSLAGAATAQSADAEITVDFSDDGLSVSVHSTKDISNIILENCAGVMHKHEGLDGNWFNHTETFGIAVVYVKSGSNNDDGPPGSGERFENEAADCDDDVPPLVTPPPVVTPPGDDDDCVDDPATVDDECTPDVEIPFFPGFTALALGSLGAIGMVALALRRRS